MTQSVACPLCGSSDPAHRRRMGAAALRAAWQARTGLDVAAELGDAQAFDTMGCGRCALEFVLPPATGSPEFYAQLQRIPWYYMPEKWEHREALTDLRPGMRALEVGCGNGHFVARAREIGISIEGIDLNAAAVREGKERGLPVRAVPLADIAAERARTFDAVCAFQVLEHIADPRGFLNDMLRALRPGGLLVVSAPNMGSFLRHTPDDPFNMPPHHVTRWSPRVFHALRDFFAMELVRLAEEPLASHHIDWYLSVRCGQLPPAPLMRGALRRALAPLMRLTGLRHLVRGHTLYGVFRKCGGKDATCAS